MSDLHARGDASKSPNSIIRLVFARNCLTHRILPALAAISMIAEPAAAQVAHTAVHPNLFVNARELERVRAKLKTEPWRAALLEQVKKSADKDNPSAAAVAYAITQDRAYGNKVRSYLLGQVEQFPGTRRDAQYPWGPSAGDAIAYDLVAPMLNAGEQAKITAYLRQLALDAIAYHEKQRLTANMSFVCHWRIGLIGYAIADKQIIDWALDEPGPPWGGKQPGRWGGFKRRIEYTLTDGAFWDEATIYGNFCMLGMMFLAEAARHYDGTDLYNYTSPNGGSLRKAIAGLVSLAYPIERTGVHKGSVRMATWGDGSTAPPNRINNEAGDAYFVNKPNIHPEDQNLYPVVEIAYHAWKDPRYEYLLSLNPERNEELGWFEYVPVALLLGESLPKANPPVPMPSAVYPQTGIALLRSDESPGYWSSRGMVAVQQMGRNYGHDHRDKLELLLWGRGRLLYPDYNSQQYEPYEYGWTRNAWAHNTLVVDESNPKGGASTHRKEFNSDVKFLATTTSENYADLTETRALLLTGEYLLDLFHADSPRERTYDWFVHAFGRLGLPQEASFRRSDDLVTPYRWIDGERKWETDQTWSADFVQSSGGVLPGMGRYTEEWFNARVGVRMTILGAEGTIAYAGEGPFNPVPNIREYGNPEGTLPLAVGRRKAKTTCFVAMHEPFDSKPVLSIRRVQESGSAVGISIRGPEFTDFACASFKGESCRLVDDGDAAQFFELRNYGYIRVKPGKVIARGNWLSFRVAAPGAADRGALFLNGKAAPYRKQGQYIIYGSDAELPRVLAAATIPFPPVAPVSLGPPTAWIAPTDVTVTEDNRHPLFPLWVVRAPGYEMRIHRKSGVSRTLIGPDGQLIFGGEWWGGSGYFEARYTTGAEETAPFAWNHPAKELQWHGQTLEVTSTSGESFTATFGPHAIRYHFHGRPGVDYRASMQTFFQHTSGVVRTPKEKPDLPATFDGFHWTYHQNPALSPMCAVLLTPREPAAWDVHSANAAPYFTIRDGDEFVLLFAPEKEIAAQAAAALSRDTKP